MFTDPVSNAATRTALALSQGASATVLALTQRASFPTILPSTRDTTPRIGYQAEAGKPVEPCEPKNDRIARVTRTFRNSNRRLHSPTRRLPFAACSSDSLSPIKVYQRRVSGDGEASPHAAKLETQISLDTNITYSTIDCVDEDDSICHIEEGQMPNKDGDYADEDTFQSSRQKFPVKVARTPSRPTQGTEPSGHRGSPMSFSNTSVTEQDEDLDDSIAYMEEGFIEVTVPRNVKSEDRRSEESVVQEAKTVEDAIVRNPHVWKVLVGISVLSIVLAVLLFVAYSQKNL